MVLWWLKYRQKLLNNNNESKTYDTYDPMGTEYFVGYLIRLGLLKKFEGEYFVG